MTDANEITPTTLKEILAGLKTQDSMQREKTSATLVKLKEWVEANQASDPFITPIDKKNNPFNEKGKCIITIMHGLILSLLGSLFHRNQAKLTTEFNYWEDFICKHARIELMEDGFPECEVVEEQPKEEISTITTGSSVGRRTSRRTFAGEQNN